MIKVGCCGWGYFRVRKYFGKGWRQKFESKLQAYATIFDLVEINYSFYKVPEKETAEKWRNEVSKVNDNFEFTVKANQTITHKDVFKTEKSVSTFEKMKDIMKALDARIMLLQSPFSWGPSKENINSFRSFLDKIKTNDIIIAWEPRGEWLNNLELIKEICEDYNLIHVVDPMKAEPQYFSTESISYFRLHGLGKSMYNYNFNEEELKHIKEKVLSLKQKTSYVLFNNNEMYNNAISFKKLF